MIDDDCIETFDRVRLDLVAVETKLAHRLGLPMNYIRRELLRLDRTQKLVEDELVSEWHRLYSSYTDWCKSTPN